LCEQHLSPGQREDLYQEVRTAVGRMTELIDSLLEFSRTSASLRPTYGSVRDTVDAATETVQSSPQFRDLPIAVRERGNVEGWFDHRKLERAFFNLLLNACESVDPNTGHVEVVITESQAAIEIRITDNGRGIPGAIRTTLFEPFISQGKENGTGLGLTVVQKIVQDHDGEIVVERTSQQGTVFRITLPRPAPVVAVSEQGTGEDSVPTAQAGVDSSKRS